MLPYRSRWFTVTVIVVGALSAAWVLQCELIQGGAWIATSVPPIPALVVLLLFAAVAARRSGANQLQGMFHIQIATQQYNRALAALPPQMDLVAQTTIGGAVVLLLGALRQRFFWVSLHPTRWASPWRRLMATTSGRCSCSPGP
jgi:hypothetical protein